MFDKKILVLSPACFTSVNRHIYRSFLKDFKDVVLLIPKNIKFQKENKQADPINISDPRIIFTYTVGSNPRLQYFKRIIKVLKNERPDFVLLDVDPLSFITLIICLNKYFYKYKTKVYSITCENIPFTIRYTLLNRGLRYMLPSFFKLFLSIILRNFVDGIFTINNEGTAIFKALKFKNVHKIPLGFDTSLFKIDDLSRKKIREKYHLDTIIISYFGRFVHEKGVHVLIDSLSKLKKYSWKLLLDEFKNYETPYIKEIIIMLEKNNLLNRVVFVDPTHLQMGEYLNASDIIVVPSISTKFWKEQYGRIVPEALGCGKIVVTSDSGSLPMVLSGMGYIFPENNSDKLAIVLESLLLSNNYYTENKKISKFAHQNLSIEKQKECMLKVFNN